MNNQKLYGFIFDSDSIGTIGIVFEISGEAGKYYICKNEFPSSGIRKDCVKIIDKGIYDYFEPRNKYIQSFFDDSDKWYLTENHAIEHRLDYKIKELEIKKKIYDREFHKSIFLDEVNPKLENHGFVKIRSLEEFNHLIEKNIDVYNEHGEIIFYKKGIKLSVNELDITNQYVLLGRYFKKDE